MRITIKSITREHRIDYIDIVSSTVILFGIDIFAALKYSLKLL